MRQQTLSTTIGRLKPPGLMVLLEPQGGLQKELNEEPRGLRGAGEGKQTKVIHQGDQGEMSQQGLTTDTRASRENRIPTLVLVLMKVTNLGGGCILEDQAEEEGKREGEWQRTRSSAGHHRRDKGPNLKIACPIFKEKKHDDPDVHIQAFEQYAELKHIEEGEWGEYFPNTLKEAARKWYYHYPASKLQSYRKLKKAFILEYTDDRGDEDILCELDRIKQGKLSVTNKKLREQEVPAPTKKFTELMHRALKLEQQAKKEKHRHKASSSDSSSSDSSEAEQTSASSSESEEDKKKKKKGSWSKKIDEMSKRISEISGLRGSSGKIENWCTKCQSKNHTSDAQCPEPDKQVAPEVKQLEPVAVRAVTRSTVVIEELPNDPPTQSKLNPKAKEWSQQRSTWKEKGKAKEYDEWQEQRELAATITERRRSRSHPNLIVLLPCYVLLVPGVTGVGVEPTGYDQSKRLRTAGDYTRPPYVPGGAYPGPPSAPTSWVPQTYIPATVPYDPYAGYGMSPSVQPLAPVPTALAPSGYAPIQNNKDNPPCNTLFIGNLGESTSETELRGLFSGQPGFKQMKVLRQGRSTVCFIEFTDVNAAIAVHNNLQGAILASSDRGGMRLQYSKNPFGKRKDFTQSSDGGAPGVGDADGASAKPILSE
ncbi:hypothetical protein L7F22_035089 [Adiantum nelumboides]|nr:hypothetical protein [Adiantum nelumboides]